MKMYKNISSFRGCNAAKICKWAVIIHLLTCSFAYSQSLDVSERESRVALGMGSRIASWPVAVVFILASIKPYSVIENQYWNWLGIPITNIQSSTLETNEEK